MDKNSLFTLEDNIVNFIFDAIFTKNLQPGTKVSESVLAKELNTSRDVVRKAFSKLQTMGILSYKKNQGFHVVWISEEDAKDIFEARKIIEAGVVEIVTKRHEKENLDLSGLLEYVENEEYLKLSQRNGEYVKSSCDFHLNLAALSQNEFLINSLRPLIPLSILAALIYEDENTEFSSYDEHRVLIDKIKSNNITNAKDYMSVHLDHCFEVLDFDLESSTRKNKFIFAN
ncbi:GntR family transcriptional regulator [Campylobacterota bacterium DY0563]